LRSRWQPRLTRKTITAEDAVQGLAAAVEAPAFQRPLAAVDRARTLARTDQAASLTTWARARVPPEVFTTTRRQI
jgi:hypothetical protein